VISFVLHSRPACFLIRTEKDDARFLRDYSVVNEAARRVCWLSLIATRC